VLDALPVQAKRMGWFVEAGRHGAKGAVQDYRALGDWGFALEHAEMPVTLWQGDADQLVPMRHAEELAAAGPRCDPPALPGGGPPRDGVARNGDPACGGRGLTATGGRPAPAA